MSQVETIILILLCTLSSPILILGVYWLSLNLYRDILIERNNIRKELFKNEIRNQRKDKQKQ